MAKRATTQKINAVTKRLFGHYNAKKERENKQKLNQQEFFDLLTELVQETQTLARKTVEIPEYWRGNPQKYVAQWYPDWVIVDYVCSEDDEDDDLVVAAIIEEDPACKAATWVNEKIGTFFAKQVRVGQIMLDDEWMQEEDPWLYNDLLERVWQLKAMDEWTTEQAVAAEKYIYRERSKPALQKPRPASPEELGHGE